MAIKYFAVLASFMFFSYFGCSNECDRGARCELEPEIGPCDAAFIRYYYNQDEGMCREFTWGGCEGVVPYETLEACEADCECSE